MVQEEEQLQCVVSWYKSWSAECRQQLLDFLVLQAVPDSVEALVQVSHCRGFARYGRYDVLELIFI